MKRLALSLLLLSAFYEAKSQTQFWSDNFEDAGAPSSGTRTPSTTFSCGAPATNYFYRTDLAGIALQSGSYTNYDGSKFWAGEDIDFGPSCSNVSISPNQQVTWSGINISGKTGLSFKGLFAANSSFASNWEGSSFAPNQDFIAVEYSIDGGPWTKALAFYASSSSQSQTLKQETTGDLIGDGADLTYTFTEFSANLTGTGTTMDIRLNVSANGSATEEIAVDNFRLFETPACPTPSLTIVSQSNVSCNGGSNGAATVSASGGTSFTYSWSPSGGSSASASGLSTGTYTCTTTNNCGSSASTTVTITQPTAVNVIAVSQTNIACNGGSNGAASVTVFGGTSGYTYNWTPGTPTGDGTANVSGLTAGTWTCTVTDANACTATQSFNLTAPTALVVSPSSQTNIACNGGSNGAASVSVSGGTSGYTYNWTPGTPTGDGTANVSGLTAGTWTCTVTDANACTATQSFNLTAPTAIVLTTSFTNVTCNGSCNGTATVTASGGTPAYTYSWAPSGGTAATATGLCAGTYTVSVTDANACTATQTVTITEPTAIVLTTSSTNVTCNGSCNGTATVTASGGTPAYTYSWAPGGGTAATASGLCAGTYTVSVTDANACTATQTVTITEPTAITGTQTLTLCAGQTITIGTNTYSTTGTYTDVLTAFGGCDSTLTTNLTVNPAIDVTTSLSGNTITANASSASYQWVDCDSGNSMISGETNQSYTATANGNYAVIVSESGCADTSACVNINSTGISGQTAGTSVQIYPNPTNAQITLEGLDSGCIVVVMNSIGQEMLVLQATSASSQTIDMSSFANGIYFIRISSTNGSFMKKIVKE